MSSDHLVAPADATNLPIARLTLHEQIVTRLRDMVTDGSLPSGQRINEVAVGEQLGVSRTPLREALKTLAGEGLIELVPGRGTVVRKFTLQGVADALEVLKALEQLAAHRACAKATDAEIEMVLNLHRRMMDCYAARDRLSYFKLNQAIHSAILEIAGNPTLARMHQMLQAQMKRIRFIGNERAEKWAGAVAEHEAMAAALAARDGAALAVLLGQHLDNTLERVRDAL
ncbi:DNA-binding GntR family transcriptional regulator [Humitalea rosea]|uniref:DNA-binding GntR family transcriptional regulator n=1 Tax=Humitalea rosea TaxID=990373 RepID=A0A2W7IIK3_9PROT|nr:GntR family transcriptional regulator [Humitalea rosea]PZW46660.1 DNA-binding GntR family transcriptional regulator [Humitalea rosea]